MGAEDLGKRLLAEVQVEEVGLDEILSTLRLDDASTRSYFGLPTLDSLVQTAIDLRASTTKAQPTAPIIELTSTSPASGKTHLLYHLTALAVLPTSLGGHQACVAIIDADNKFSIPRLAQHMARLCHSKTTSPEALQATITTSLTHIHIFHPQSLPSTIATVQSLQSYLFNANRHHSFDRAVAFIALESAAAFYWQAKSDAEEASLHPSSAQPSGYVQLAGALKNAGRILNTPILFTCWDMSSAKKGSSFGQDIRSYRSSLPPPWQTLPTLRLVVRRIPVRKLPVEIGVEEALREGEMRQKVVELGRFECFVNEWGLDERSMQRFQANGGGFEFRIRGDGVHFDEEKDG
ncbi:hypothetical protein M409DRAFT_19552 [Zasmidium cellare ATCC 36951]|uniref:DNA recombination and repair protein Rad51-like C-terminal domain-containing protein n=1 Tax=Zasmidium cellare ATCC 36951 TaxID=1080233 RepID=A0A6A6CS85_ZASCE|nr:uncharacterized protein M409DRAFT_19552 [Zasmidium cellare ATCC 36951]KAF2169935.1 hypothetical protein M409DRAFT_19552 [Zasmidium cellare ATCC 36951]